VNAAAPGYVTDTERFGASMTPERHARLVGRTLLGRPGALEEVAALVAFVCSPEGGYLSGQVLHLNGGAAFGR